MATFDSRTPTVDTFINSDSPTARNDTSTALAVRNFRNGAGTQRRSIVLWDLSSLAGATINSASLTFNNQITLTNGANYIACYRLDTYTPTNAATWNRYDGANDWDTGGGDYAAAATDTIEITPLNNNAVAGDDCEFDVAADVQNFVNGTHTNRGWLLRFTGNASENEDGKWDPQSDATEADRPRLLIDYTEAAGGIVPLRRRIEGY